MPPPSSYKFKFLMRGATTGQRVGMLTGGALGALHGSRETVTGVDGKEHHRSIPGRVLGGIGGGLFGTLGGGVAGGIIGANVNKYRWEKTLPRGLAKALSKATNDIEVARVKRDYKDRFGFLDKKAAMLEGFADELLKIAQAKQAAVGAILGGAAGYHFAPNTPTGKAVGAVGGALLGAGIEGTAKKSKQVFIDELAAREHADLYGYMPAASQMPVQGSNFY